MRVSPFMSMRWYLVKIQLKNAARYIIPFGLGLVLGVSGIQHYPRYFKWVSLPHLSVANFSSGAAQRNELDKRADYQKYFENIFAALRREPKVRMRRVFLHSSVLYYNRTPAMLNEDYLKLRGKGAVIPFIAMSRNTKTFLEKMRIAHVEPERVPVSFLAGVQPSLSVSALRQFLLVPDVSGANIHSFIIQKN